MSLPIIKVVCVHDSLGQLVDDARRAIEIRLKVGLIPDWVEVGMSHGLLGRQPLLHGQSVL